MQHDGNDQDDERKTERLIEETGVGDPLAGREPEQPAKPASEIDPEDASPEEGMERPETDEPRAETD
jgi:hypothetical protein